MSANNKNIFNNFWDYLAQTQTKLFKISHALIAVFIFLQIIDSNYMSVHYGANSNLNYGTYFHIFIGCSLTILSFILIVSAFKKRGLSHYYPYIFNRWDQIIADTKTLLFFKMPKLRAGGIAATYQGFGLVSLVLVLVSGLLWWLLWSYGSTYAHSIQIIHKKLTALIEFYIFSHGFIGIVHFILSKYKPSFVEK